jgi:small subunit ribosomal protein S11
MGVKKNKKDENNKETDKKKSDVVEAEGKIDDSQKTEIKKSEKKVKTTEVKEKKAEDRLEDLPDNVKDHLEKRKKETSKKSTSKGRKRKKKEKKHVTVGKAYIKSTYNNTIVSLTDLNGDIIAWASAGIAGFKGPKKSTPYAAQIITRIAVQRAREHGLKEVSVYVKGVGTGRESAVRALNANGLLVTSIKDVTPMPHNGCRARKPRRV